MQQPDPAMVKAWHAGRALRLARLLRPRPRISGSEWADEYGHLPDDSPEPGRFRMRRVPYLREPLDAVCSPIVEEVAAMKGSQIGWTVAIYGMGAGYFIHQRPQPILIYQPTEDDAKTFSRSKLTSMIEATPVLLELIGQMRSRDSGNTILHKEFPGGSLDILWAVARAFRMRSAGVVFADEVDEYDDTPQGDPITLLATRLTAYRHPKLVLASTPTNEGDSRIETAYEDSDQRKYYVPCPHCDHGQVLVWGRPDEDRGFKWDSQLVRGRKVHVPGTVSYLCESCHVLIEERDKPRMIAEGKWVPQVEGVDRYGYHIPQFLAPFHGTRWEALVSKWDVAYDNPEKLQAFVNHVLAETWKERDLDFDADKLSARGVAYPAEVPNGVGVLAASCDVQHDRLEFQVKGFGLGEESWLIGHHRLAGDTDDHTLAPWTTLLHELRRPYMHESGQRMRISAVMIDAGDGARMQTVCRFVKGLERQGIYAVMGTDSRQKETLRRQKKRNRHGVRPWTVDTFALKRIVSHRLKVEKPGPRYMHFPAPTLTGTDDEYFEQFGSVVWRPRRFAGKRILKPETLEGHRDEAFDLEVYCLAALYSMGDPIVKRLGQLAAEATKEPSRAAGEGSNEKPVTAARPRRKNWVNGWRQ